MSEEDTPQESQDKSTHTQSPSSSRSSQETSERQMANPPSNNNSLHEGSQDQENIYPAPDEEDEEIKTRTTYVIDALFMPSLLWFLLCVPDLWNIINSSNSMGAKIEAIISYFSKIDILTVIIYTIIIVTMSIMTLTSISKKDFDEPQKINLEDDEDANGKKQGFVFPINIKSLLTLSPVALSLTFIFILRYYMWATDENIGIAFQITSLQVTQDKYRLLSYTLIIILIIYILPIPAMNSENLWRLHKDTSLTQVVPRTSKDHLILMYWTLTLTLFTSFIASLAFRLVAPDLHAPLLLNFVATSFIIAQIKMLHPSPLTIIKDLFKFIEHGETWKAVLTITISASLFIASTTPIHDGTLLAGKIISTAGTSESQPINAYSCIFSKNSSSNESLAFGILISSNEKAVRIYAPTQAQDSKEYSYFKDNKLYPNMPTESYVNTKEDYLIESYNEQKHEFNPHTGKCKRR
ncbi:hypothetical protein [Rothia mucilaginosa]|uniref:hypothetical protein n=1 Tax=Rothia mucilaginosa TaxID=43675 RepID=UPI003A8B1B8B